MAQKGKQARSSGVNSARLGPSPFSPTHTLQTRSEGVTELNVHAGAPFQAKRCHGTGHRQLGRGHAPRTHEIRKFPFNEG